VTAQGRGRFRAPGAEIRVAVSRRCEGERLLDLLCSEAPMSIVLRRGPLAAALLSLAAAAPAAAQDSGKTPDAMTHDSAMHQSMAGGMMSHDSMHMGAMAGRMTVAHGTFTGAHGHTVSGGYAITQRDGNLTLTLDRDFRLDGAPDPYVVLSASDMGGGDGTVSLGRLVEREGSTSFTIPAGTDLARMHRVLIWCRKFRVTLGQAELASALPMPRQ
jgi:Electron transfer DM13